MTTRRALLAAGLAAAFASACGRELARQAPRAVPTVTPRPVGATPLAENAVAGMTAFGANLLGLVAKPTKNAVVSPLSIAYAFGMARVGARAETASQIDEVLGFPPDPHPTFQKLAGEIVTTDTAPPASTAKREPGDKPQPPVVAIANGLFVHDDITVVQAFLDTLKQQYGAGVERVDFTKPQAKDQIDAWVREHTADRIKKLFDKLDPRTKLVIANAVYLKADWADALASDAGPAVFHAPAGNITVPMIGGTPQRRRLAVSDGWQAVELTYAASELAMWLLVPIAEATPVALLEPAVLAEVADGLAEQQVELTMPRWDFGTDLNLVPPLQGLGMLAPFEPGVADFSGMLRDVWIDQVIHRANITVDNYGTEAAAVTGISAREMMSSREVRVLVDRPFAFAIMHLPTQTPLFLGQVVDPTAKT